MEVDTLAVLLNDKRIESIYTDICDVVARSLYEIPEEDTFKHTSSEARRVATRILEVLAEHGLSE